MRPPVSPEFASSPLPAAAADGNLRKLRMIRHRRMTVLALAALAMVTGCVTENPPRRAGANRSGSGIGPLSGSTPHAIRELNLLTMPTALNLDAQPGADGVAVKIFAIRAGEAKASPLRDGRLEIFAFEGTLDPSRPTPSFHSWTFSPDQLRPQQFTAALGTGYNLLLDWSPKVLQGTRLTLIARYHPPEGPPVVSAPGFVAATTL